jgi:hypothetical protein
MENKKVEDQNELPIKENLMQEEEPKVEEVSVEEIKETPTKSKKPIKTYIFSIISIAFLAVSFSLYSKYVLEADKIPVKKITYSKDIQAIRQTKKVTIYFPNDSLSGFKSDEIEISKESFHLEMNSIFLNIKSHSSYLIKGSNDKYYPFLDSSVTLLNSYLVGDKLYLNLSGNIKENIHSKKQELYILYSLINTYTSIPGIKKVKIIIDGVEVSRLKWYGLKNFYTQDLKI